MRNENSMKLEGLALIKDYRKNPDKYLPAIDHTEEVPAVNEYGERNIGWYAGLLEENRIFFAVLASGGISHSESARISQSQSV